MSTAINLTFITGVKFYKSLIQMLNSITYIYDPNWNPKASTEATLPVCFFHVKGYHEIMSSEVSQKQALFYNTGTSNRFITDPTQNSGALNVIADNIVIKPKQYKLDVIIPYKELSLLNQSFVFNQETMHEIQQTLMAGGESSESISVAKSVASWATLSQPYVKFIKEILSTLMTHSWQSFSTESVKDFINNTMNQPDYNKNSLELMWRLRRVLKLKVWNSWKYKYVVINDIDISKDGAENGVYRGSITVQEIPMLTLHSKQIGTTPYYFNNAVNEVKGEALKILLNKLEVTNQA